MWWSRHYDAFISYSHKDNDVVKPLVELLSVNEHRVFWDHNLKAGDRWDAAIRSSIKDSGIFVLFWCCDTRGSEYIAEELALALRLKKKIVPVKLCAAAMPPPLGEWQWIDLRQRVQHLCVDVDHQQAGDTLIVSRQSSPPSASKKWMVPLAAALALLLLSGLFFERRASRTAKVALPKPVTAEFQPSYTPPVAASPWYANRAILFPASSLVVIIALSAGVIATRRKRASHTLSITMDYLHGLQRGS